MTLSLFWFAKSSNDDTPRPRVPPLTHVGHERDTVPLLPDDHPDAQTVRRVREGDVGAFSQMFLAYHRRLWAFAYDLTGSGDTAEELVQEMFAAIWTRHATWQVRSSIAEYLFGAVRNLVYTARRRSIVIERSTQDAIAQHEIPAYGATPTDPSRAAELSDLRIHLAQVIAAMPEGRRTAFLLRWDEQLSYAEIATVMGTSVKAVGVQLSRALQDLRTALKDLM